MIERIEWSVTLVVDGASTAKSGHIRISDVYGTPSEVFAMCATMVAEQIREALLAEAKK